MVCIVERKKKAAYDALSEEEKEKLAVKEKAQEFKAKGKYLTIETFYVITETFSLLQEMSCTRNVNSRKLLWSMTRR